MHTLRIFLDTGRRGSAHSSGAGKVLLAHLKPNVLARTLDGWVLTATTEHTITDVALLRRELVKIHEQGWARNCNEHEVGVTSVAAPVRDRTRQVVAALSVAGPTTRMNSELPAITQAVVEAAALASRRLGHQHRVAP